MNQLKQIRKPNQNSKKKITSIRVQNEIAEILKGDLIKINDKKIGKKIKLSHYIKFCRDLIKDEHFDILKTHSLTNSDRIELSYQSFISKNSKISKDEFLGKLLNGEVKIDENHKERLV